MRAAAILAALLAAAHGAPASGQARPNGGVTITSRAGVKLAPPRVRPAPPMVMAAGGPLDVQRWFDKTDAPAALPGNQRVTAVLARELTIENRNWVVDSPMLVVVADTLRVGANGTIDLSARPARAAGGKLYVIARRIACDSGGTLQLVSRGGPMGGAGGQVVVVPGLASVGAVPPCLRSALDGGPGGTVQVRDHRTNPPTLSTRTLPNGPRGSMTATSLQAATDAEPVVRTAWSMWAVEWLETLQLDIYDASRANDSKKVLKLLRDYEGFDVPTALIAPDMRERYRSLLEDLNTYRQTALPALMVEEITVRPGGLPQNVTVFTEGATLRASLAPTHALAARENVAGRSVLGLLEYRNERPDELSIEVEWELTVDPWMERLAAEQLNAAGQRLDGVFAGWALEPKPMQELGIRSASGTLLPGGKRLRVRFVVDAERANLVFWRLLNSAGIPWTVDWRFTEPRSGRVVTGTWAGPPLSLVRQRDPLVTVNGGQIANDGTSPVTVNYVKAGDGSFVALNPTIRLAPGEKAAAPGGVTAASVPPEAVETAFDPDRFAADFHVLNAEQVVDHVVITNTLPTSDDQRGAFDYLEISVTASVEGDSTAAPAIAGPFRLAASGTRGGEIALPFLRLARGTRRITVAGRAYYANGYRTLTPTSFDTLTVAITKEMFQE
ncbi:MAG TPA: hypothetical protein VF147_14500 [Vicinamibacterales bacterium]